MGRWKCIRSNVCLSISLLLVLLIAQDFATLPAAAADTGSVQTPTRFSARGTLVGRTDTQKPLTLAVALKVQDEAGLDTFLHELYDPASSHYRQYLTPQQFTGQFISAASRKQVADYLRTQGLTVSDPGVGATLTATAAVAQVERAFSVTISDYKAASGRIFFANDKTPAVPPAIAQIIQGIVGLDNAAESEPQLVRGPVQATQRDVGANATPSGCTSAVSRANKSGSYTPNEFATAYNFDAFSAKGFHGEGQTIALFELADYLDADASTYQSCFGSNVLLQRVAVDGGGALGGVGELEVELDIDVITGMVPKLAKLLVYESPNAAQSSVNQYQKIANDNLARVVSSSWGGCESSYTPTYYTLLNTVFKQMATQGQTALVVTGDFGSTGCSTSTALAVQAEGAQPYVTAVGGTKLTLLSNNAYSSEATWNDYSVTGGAGGGGLSTYWAKPSY